MTKHKRIEFELTNPNPEVNAEDNTTESVAQPGIDVEGPREGADGGCCAGPRRNGKGVVNKGGY